MTASGAPTMVVELTPPGRAAVAVVVVEGPNALAAVQHFFAPKTPWRGDGPPIGRIMLGHWGGEQGEELIICRRAEHQFEIHCHGGSAAVNAIVEQLVGQGCIKLTWQESVRRSRGEASSEPGNDSPSCAAAIALAGATTARTAGVLLDQYHGALSAAIEAARAALASADSARAKQIIEGILKFRELGLHLTTPWRVVIAGPPNVGKSSLINAIAGYQRAIVSPLPGTTRDVVTLMTAINGWPVQIADTAGLRDSQDELESAGVALAGAAIERAELVIVVSDASMECRGAEEILNRLEPAVRVIHAVNKIDLVDGGEDAPARVAAQGSCSSTVRVSAVTGQGIPKLLAAMEHLLVPNPPPAGAAVAFTPAQIAVFEAACAAIDQSNFGAADAALTAMLSTDGDGTCTA